MKKYKAQEGKTVMQDWWCSKWW